MLTFLAPRMLTLKIRHIINISMNYDPHVVHGVVVTNLVG